MIKTALAYLNQDRALHIDMIELILRQEAKVLHASFEGVLLLDLTGSIAFLSATTSALYESFIKQVSDVQLVVTHQDYPLSSSDNTWILDMTCTNHYYPLANIEPNPTNLSFRALSIDDLSFVHHHYSHGEISYLQQRLEKQAIIGAFRKDLCVGFIGTHEEGSMGLLVVLEAYRHQGIGESLLQHMIQLELSRGHCPYSQVVLNNQASLHLHHKYHFIQSTSPIYWYYHR